MQQFYVSQSPDKVIVSMIEKKMINFIIMSCYTQLEVFFQIKFHPGMKLFLFHPGMRFHLGHMQMHSKISLYKFVTYHLLK